MRKKNILKVLSLLAAVCITAGCSGSTAAIQDTVTESLADDVNYEENSEQPLFQKEFEITDWTMEDLVGDMTICGKKLLFHVQYQNFQALLKLKSLIMSVELPINV